MARFRSKARLVEILGEHLIKDNTVGLLELVKNAYDADATKVEICLEDLALPTITAVTVKDNGDGMTLETVEGPWLEPAHGGKELQKEKQIRSKRGRLPLGEKGVGRFAAHKLGRQLTLVTRHFKSEKEVVLEIDWTPFESHETYLEEINLDPKERKPEIFLGANHGTCLTMRSARERWREEDLRRLQASLQKLKSPTKGAVDFEVSLRCSEYPKYEDLDAVGLLAKAHFSFTGIVDENGRVDFDYHEKFAGTESEQQREKRNLWGELYPKIDRNPACGQFYVNLNGWIRKAELLRQAGVTKEQLNAFCGVSLFRDGIRVLPYGDEGDDWLLLDKRRIDDPTHRFANNQVIGFIEINQTDNRTLVDKANREGLQENQAFEDMRALVKACVKLLEQYSAAARNKATGESKTEASKAALTSAIDEVENAARKTEEQAHATAKVIQELEFEGWVKPESAKIAELQMQSLAAQVAHYREKTEGANHAIKEFFSSDEKEREAFLHLVAVGLVAERFTHEFARVVGHCSESIQQLRVVTKSDASAREAVKDLERHIGELQTELIPLGNMVHRTSPDGKEECDVHALVKTIIANNQERMKRGHIVVRVHQQGNGVFVAPLRESLLAQVLDNLFDNSIYWLGEKSARDDRKMAIHLDSDTRTILLTNNGPAIRPNMRGALFQKFQSSKLRGRGLGLFICRELLARRGASIEVADRDSDNRCLDGASFIIELP